MRRLIVAIAVIVAVTLTIATVELTQAGSGDSEPPIKCYMSSTMPQEQANGDLISEGAYRCTFLNVLDFGILARPYFHVCGVREYKWLGLTRTEDISCSSRLGSYKYAEVRYSCEGKGTYYTELRWSSPTWKDAADWILLIAVPPSSLLELAENLLDSAVSGGPIDNNGRYRDPTGYVCTQ